MTTTTMPDGAANGAPGGAEGQMLSSHKDAQNYVSQAVLLLSGGNVDSSKPTVVNCGELACQHDSYLQSMEASSILSYASFEEKAVAPKEKKGKSKPYQLTVA